MIKQQKEMEKNGYEILTVDFNTTISIKENKGGSIVKDSFREHLENLIEKWDLIDISPKRGTFTWINRRKGK